jgi:hypothetical protein
MDVTAAKPMANQDLSLTTHMDDYLKQMDRYVM